MKYQQLVAMPASVQDWLDHELEMRGIDAVVYTRYILSLLQQENFDSESADGDLFPTSAKQNLKEVPVGRSKGKSKLRADRIKSLTFEDMRKSAAVECLMSVSDQKCGIEKLVDELCDKLKSIQGNDNARSDQQDIYDTATLLDANSLASSSPEEQAEKYYEAFPALSAIEPLEMSETQNLENVVSSVWDNKKIAGRQEANENISNAENALSSSTPTEENNKQEKELGKEECLKTAIETNISYDLGTMEDLIKPSFIVPKYKTNITNRQKLPLVKGKTPFNVPLQKTYPDTFGLRCPKKRLTNAGKFVIDQHSEENTEESSLDNSFDDDFPLKSSLTSTIDSFEDDVSDGKSDPFSESNDPGDVAEIITVNGNAAAVNKEDEILAKLTAKFNESVAAIWSDELSKGSQVSNLENIWQTSPYKDIEKNDEDSALMLPQHLRSLFTCRTDPAVNVVWVHSKVLKEPNEAMPEETEFLTAEEKISPEESTDEAAEEILISRAAEKLPSRGLFRSTLWEWNDGETFIQGGVYGSVLPGNNWKISNTNALTESDVCQNSPTTDSDDSLLESEVDSEKNVSGEDEMQYVWNILGSLGSALQKNIPQDEAGEAEADHTHISESSANDSSFADEAEMLDMWRSEAGEKPPQVSQLEDKLIDLKSIWNSMHYDVEPIKIKVPTPHFQPRENEVANSIMWSMQQSPQHGPLLTRSYDSYLNKMLTSEIKNSDNEDGAFRSEPTLLPAKNCTLTYHKGESRFVEVIPSAKTDWLQVPSQNVQPQNYKHVESCNNDDDDQENLLTSPKTHFRPIRQDSCESDTTGSSDNGEEHAISDVGTANIEPVSSVNESREITSTYDLDGLYLNYKDDGGESSDELCNLARDLDGSKEKFCQTEACLSSDEYTQMRKENDYTGSDRDDCTEILNAVIDVLDGMLDRKLPGDENLITDHSDSSSKSISPLSLNDDEEIDGTLNEFHKYPSILTNVEASTYDFENTLYYDARNVWRSLDDVYTMDSGMNKWSTAQEERSFWFENHVGASWNSGRNAELHLSEDGQELDEVPTRDIKPNTTNNNMKSLREEIKDEEEQLFEDIDNQRILHLENNWGTNSLANSESKIKPDWLPNALATLNMNSVEDEICPELEMIHCRQQVYSSSDGDDGTFAEMRYSEHSLKYKDVGSFQKKLPIMPTNKVLYSEDLEEEWRRNGRLADLPGQIPKIKFKKIAPQKRPCSFYLEGNCRRSDCKFSHDLASITCRFWEEGSCFKGITCPFLHGYHSEQNKENSGHKSEFKLELESETHFPSLSKPRMHSRKQELCHSSSSDSTPMAPNKRRRKRSALKQRLSSPHGQMQSLTKSAKGQSLSKEPRSGRTNRGSSSEDDTVDI